MSLNSNVAGVSWACSFGNDDSLFVCRYTVIKNINTKNNNWKVISPFLADVKNRIFSCHHTLALQD